jgi:hypothetical protein
MHSGHLEVPTTHEIASPTRIALKTMSTMPAYAYPLTIFPGCNTHANFIDNTGDLMPRDSRILQTWPNPLLHDHVTMTNPTGLHFNADLVCSRCWDLLLDYFKWRAR